MATVIEIKPVINRIDSKLIFIISYAKFQDLCLQVACYSYESGDGWTAEVTIRKKLRLASLTLKRNGAVYAINCQRF